MSTTAWMYVAYLGICIGIMVWVARILRRHGLVLLTAGRTGEQSLADALSHLLIVGFYLVNLGAIAFYLKASQAVASIEGAFETGSDKVGAILVVIGVMHFVIVGILTINRRHDDERLAEEGYRNARLALSEKSGLTNA